MSRYLSRRIEQTPNIQLLTQTEIIALLGDDRLRGVRWRNDQTGVVEEHPIAHAFMMTGATPNTTWLDGCIALDEQSFVKTGLTLSPEDLAATQWPLVRPPFLLETSLPGVFAVGDVRGGSVKRVASAVREGSIAISLVHQGALTMTPAVFNIYFELDKKDEVFKPRPSRFFWSYWMLLA